ncbi:pyruvate kinase-like isoform X2 [Daktulosphaira vitifoliae]|uniref:pyruvate kinase-like isoform X2 n=1 Tax=Daktulosphaira vitifoliae TaxID=58002 RepID=UPI0021AA79F2|nr:pyruvate kinase-like isoform X2 [Daktulosphaira vitifoliae]
MINTEKLSVREHAKIFTPYCDNENMQIKSVFESNYLDHMSNLNLNLNSSHTHTLTTLACAVPPNITQDLISQFCEKGVSMVMVGFNELSNEECQKMIYEIRQGVFKYSVKNNQIPYSLAIVLNLEGNQIITGSIIRTKVNQTTLELPTNNYVYITNDEEYKDKCTPERIYINTDIKQIKENDPIFLDYGKIELIVTKVETEELQCKIKRGGLIGSKRVVLIPGIPIPTLLTEEDENRIRIGIRQKVDVILIPGVRNAAFINRVKDFVRCEKGQDIDLYAKIDNSVGFDNINEIIPNADGIFLDLPNLSMEIGHEKIFIAQKIILSKCNIMGKAAVTHGAFLSSMEFTTIPSNAEVNNVINTVLDGTDAIYLDVTLRTNYQVFCLHYLSFICRQGESAIWEQHLFNELNHKSKPKIDPAQAISIGCVEVSLKCNATAIIVISTSGLSARNIARYRPRCPIIAITKLSKASRKLSVWRNLTIIRYLSKKINCLRNKKFKCSVICEFLHSSNETNWSTDIEIRTNFAINFGKKKGILKNGDLILLMCGNKQGIGFTNTMKILYVN